METVFFNNVKASIVKFKSYYVVWKQDMKKKIKETEEQFKSYYVVWKLWPYVVEYPASP